MLFREKNTLYNEKNGRLRFTVLIFLSFASRKDLRMETANTDIMVIVHYNVVNGGDKRGHALASTVIYKMEDIKESNELC